MKGYKENVEVEQLGIVIRDNLKKFFIDKIKTAAVCVLIIWEKYETMSCF